MKRFLLFLVLTIASPLSAQETEREAMLRDYGLALRLQMPVEVRQPTVVVLIEITNDSSPMQFLREAKQRGDSIVAALSAIVGRRGYLLEVRATTHQGLVDASNNAVYRASPNRGPGILLITPGRRPSRLIPLAGPPALDNAITEYERPIRQLQPL